jgi:multidrug efflux pump subunit AcrB
MSLAKLAVENRQFTNIVLLLLVAFGIVSFITMPRSEDPQVSPAGTTVVVIYPGANPADMEELVVEPVEEAINELEDIKELTSTAEDGLAVIAVEFTSGSDPDEKYSDVVQKVNSVRTSLPENILSLDMTKWSISDVNILQIALVSDVASYRRLEQEAEDLKKLFEKSFGVKRVQTWAFPEQQIRVELDFERMAKMYVPLDRVFGLLESENQNIPGGYLDVGPRRFNIQTSGSFKSIEDIRNVIVQSNEGHIIHLKDIADVHFSYGDEQYIARVNGRRAVLVTVQQKEGTNIFRVIKALKEKTAGFAATLPSTVKMATVFDQSQSVSYRLNNFFINLLQGLVLVGLVMLLGVGVRAAAIVVAVIPFSILIGIGGIDISNYGLQQMTIAGLVIALGLLVDNAIVVTENIARFMRLGYDRKTAAFTGTSQVSWAIVSATATTVLAFVPMMAMQNITGDFIRSMPLTVVYTLSASLLLSLSLTPYLSYKFLNVSPDKKESYIRRKLDWIIEKYYRKTLDYALEKPKRILLLALFIFLISLAMFPLVGISFFPKAEKPQFIINVNSPEGTNLQKTDETVRFIEKILAQRREVELFASNIGHGNPRIYYNIVPENEKSSHAQIFVQLTKNDLATLERIVHKLRTTFADLPGVKIEVKEFEQGPPVEAPVAIRVMGDNLDRLREIAVDVERIVASTAGTINIKNPLATTKTDMQVKINREKAGMFGVPLINIDRAVRTGLAGMPVSSYRDEEGKEYDIVIRSPFAGRPDLSLFDKIYVSSLTGAHIPLKQLASLEFKATSMVINHYNMNRNVTVTADVAGTYSVNKVTQSIIQRLDAYPFPKGYRYGVGGELESREESFGGMSKSILVALFGIFAVLVLQFRSYGQPLIVFSAIPLAIIGSIFALLLTGNSFSFTAFIGLTSLVGIVVNNSIILIDYTNQLKREGKEFLAALKEAGETRFVPILLTTATTVGGLLPLTLRGGTLWAPMGWTVIGGLLVSTFLTLIIVPVLYSLLPGKE